MLCFSSNTAGGAVCSVINGVNGNNGLLDVVVQDCTVTVVTVVAGTSSIATSFSSDSGPNSWISNYKIKPYSTCQYIYFILVWKFFYFKFQKQIKLRLQNKMHSKWLHTELFDKWT